MRALIIMRPLIIRKLITVENPENGQNVLMA
jgi:hypothetical protein